MDKLSLQVSADWKTVAAIRKQLLRPARPNLAQRQEQHGDAYAPKLKERLIHPSQESAPKLTFAGLTPQYSS
jgi:hypothetical protein